MGGLVTSLSNYSWKDYVTSNSIDENIQLLIVCVGWFYLLCGIISLFIQKLPKVFHYLLLFGAFNLILLAFFYSKEKFFHIGQFLEYALQFGSPIFLYLYVNQLVGKEKLILLFKITIALTFSCHGLYAIGFYPRPESFLSMTMGILRVNQETAIIFLNTAALLDFIISIGIFLHKRIAIPLLVYATFWGFMTSIARIWANFYPEFWLESLNQWSHETILRMPHFLIPIALIFLLRNKSNS